LKEWRALPTGPRPDPGASRNHVANIIEGRNKETYFSNVPGKQHLHILIRQLHIDIATFVYEGVIFWVSISSKPQSIIPMRLSLPFMFVSGKLPMPSHSGWAQIGH
jgi:hypothetical protein